MRCRLIGAASILALAAWQGPARAQSTSLKLGVNLAAWEGDDASDWDGITTFAGGLAFESVSAGASYEIDLLYAMKGAEGESGGMTYTYELAYVEVPLLIRVSSGRGSTRGKLVIGPYFAYLLDAELTTELMGFSISGDATDAFEELDYGVMVGVGVESRTASLEARYSLGLTDVPDGSSDIQNSTISILLGVTF